MRGRSDVSASSPVTLTKLAAKELPTNEDDAQYTRFP